MSQPWGRPGLQVDTSEVRKPQAFKVVLSCPIAFAVLLICLQAQRARCPHWGGLGVQRHQGQGAVLSLRAPAPPPPNH